MDEEERQDDLEACWDQVDSGQMPPRIYLPLHPSARLSASDKVALKAYVLNNRSTANR